MRIVSFPKFSFVMVAFVVFATMMFASPVYAGPCENSLAASVAAEKAKCDTPPSPACLEAAEDKQSFQNAYEACKSGELQAKKNAAAASTKGDYGLGETASKSGLPNSGESDTIPSLVGGIILAVLGLVATLFFFLMVYAGFLWMTSRGSPDQVGKAKTLLTQAIVGVVIIAGAWAITNFVIGRLQNL